MVKSDDSLESCSMSKHHLAVDVADRIDMRNIGLHGPVIDNNPSWREFNACISEIQRVNICFPSYSHQDPVSLDGFFLAFAGIGHLVY